MERVCEIFKDYTEFLAATLDKKVYLQRDAAGLQSAPPDSFRIVQDPVLVTSCRQRGSTREQDTNVERSRFVASASSCFPRCGGCKLYSGPMLELDANL